MTDATPNPEITPTGTRIPLHHEGPLGSVEAEVATVAAALCALTVGGAALVEPIPRGSTPPFGTGTVLSPWPNRVRDGRWELDGQEQVLDLTERERGNALHGLLRHADYVVRERTASSVTLGALIAPQHGWPFLLDTWVSYELVDDGLRVRHGVTNLADRSAPYAIGTHPFLRVGDTPVEELTLTAPAPRFVEVDERLNPVGVAPVAGTARDLTGGSRVGDLDLDTAYAGVEHRDGASAWLTAPDGARTELLQDPDWSYLQVFTTDLYPDQTDGHRRRAVAVEPMTAPPDALNSGEGLVWLEPGSSWSGGWGLRYVPAG
ncbi:MAG: aldose 1-epimerase family protein [Actinomycetales bacterium]|nr:aldose 1-epimerase family protein [Actinomycetales bacterium]